MVEAKKPSYIQLNAFITDSPCVAVNMLYHMLDIDINRDLETEEFAGPFDEEWIKNLKEKQQIRDKFKDIVEKCEKERKIKE